jgi:ectoine hydroxylase-related dioxygenase (phytanoyl-CoA dioxygenase family)
MKEAEMNRIVTSADIEAYNRDGVTVLRQIVNADWRAQLAAAIERDMAQPGPFYHGYESEDGGRFHGNLRLWESDATMREFCLHSPLPALAQQFFHSTKVNLLYDQLFVKEAATANRTRWHNDQPYWPMRGWQVLSFWLALDETTAESGALEFVRGSHHWNRWFQPETFGRTAAVSEYEANPNYEPMPDIDAARAEYDIVSWNLEPGDAYVFHGLTVHGAGGNRLSNRRRRGYTIRYTGDDVVYDTRPGTNVHLRNAALRDGDALDSAQYPVVFPAQEQG